MCWEIPVNLVEPGGEQQPTESSKQPIRARYLGHVTGHQPIRDQYFLIRSVPGGELLDEKLVTVLTVI